MARTSAGLLPYRRDDVGAVVVFVAHMGGPLWAKKDLGGWSIVKGEYDAASEDARAAAAREFAEETGAAAPRGPWHDLGELRGKSGKVIRAWAVEAPSSLALVEAGTFEMEWPPRSGRRQLFPEIDRAEWMSLDAARERLAGGQSAFLDRLIELLGAA